MKQTELIIALNRKLASTHFPEEKIILLANNLNQIGEEPFDIFSSDNGVSVDFLIPKSKLLELMNNISKQSNVGSIRMFPKKIVEENQFLIQVELYVL